MDDKMKENLKSQSTWTRILYMLLFGVIYTVAEVVVFAVALFQVISILFNGQKNVHLLNFGSSLSAYVYQIIQFFTFNRDVRPFPFDKWPEENIPRATILTKVQKESDNSDTQS